MAPEVSEAFNQVRIKWVKSGLNKRLILSDFRLNGLNENSTVGALKIDSKIGIAVLDFVGEKRLQGGEDLLLVEVIKIEDL